MTGGERAVQLISVLAIVTCTVAIAVPKIAESRRHDEAARVVADVETVRSAVYRFYSDSAYFPPESFDGSVPDALIDYLPLSYSLNRPWGSLQYKNWPMEVPVAVSPVLSPLPPGTVATTVDTSAAADTTDADPAVVTAPADTSGVVAPPQPAADPVKPPAPNVVGITIVTRDPRIAAAASSIAWETPQFTIGNKFTFIIFGR